MADRILTTHVGSLPRPDGVCALLRRKLEGDPPDRATFEACLSPAVDAVVARQVKAGIDIVSDGEFAKLGYANYLSDRLSGFSGDSPRLPGADLADFPAYAARLGERRRNALPLARPCCTGPIEWTDRRPLEDDLARLRAAVTAHAPEGAFMNAPSPGVVAIFQPNRFYDGHEAYLEAIARAMKEEYRAIVEAGFFLQIDCPDLGMGRHTIFQHEDEAAFLRHARRHVEILNEALDGLPPERLRMHLCWGNYEGPHHKDVPLEKIVDIVLGARPRTLLFEAANPRHAHEWQVFAEARIPEDKILCPGVIDSCSNYIEHPRLIAERLLRFADIVGAERVMAGSDCGFSTFAGDGLVDGEIVFAKFEAMAEGARIASARLWKGEHHA
ncbi:MAG: cobalamin-independent methionine synthase II family protein [Geminicoccaceae bacterium]|nr:cobalamin-independent methionine synthase II family protein [Geminicoccaceae bacterium]